MTRLLTDEEVKFCEKFAFTRGYDDDQPELTQHTHICWPASCEAGAFCGTNRLWTYGGSLKGNDISCEQCIVKLQQVLHKDPELLVMLAKSNSYWSKEFDTLAEVQNMISGMGDINKCSAEQLRVILNDVYDRLKLGLVYWCYCVCFSF